jgi:ferric-dicitrate binding protein FerR (iron transport regulator)
MQLPLNPQQMTTVASIATTLSVFGVFALWVIRAELAKFKNALLEALDQRYVARAEYEEAVKRLEGSWTHFGLRRQHKAA